MHIKSLERAYFEALRAVGHFSKERSYIWLPEIQQVEQNMRVESTRAGNATRLTC